MQSQMGRVKPDGACKALRTWPLAGASHSRGSSGKGGGSPMAASHHHVTEVVWCSGYTARAPGPDCLHLNSDPASCWPCSPRASDFTSLGLSSLVWKMAAMTVLRSIVANTDVTYIKRLACCWHGVSALKAILIIMKYP